MESELMMSFCKRFSLRSAMRRLVRDERGNFAIMGALAAVPLLLATGGAIDYSMMYSAKLKVQNAVDSAALAAAKQYSVDPDPARLAAYAENYFRSNVSDLYRTTATLTYEGTSWTDDHARQVQVHADFVYRPMFLPLSEGLSGSAIRVASAVMVSDTTVEVALVLDTSGSMADAPSAGGESKIVTLRRTARSAAAKFFAASGTGSEKPTMVGVIPFSGAVNVGATNLDAWWMDPKGLSPLHHENLDWKTYTDARGNPMWVEPLLGKGFFLASNPTIPLTRQYLLKNMKTPTYVRDTSICTYKLLTYPLCTWSGSDGSWVMKLALATICTQAADPTGCHPYRITYSTTPMYELKGCVEARRGVYGITDTTPNSAVADSLFVPYMAVDEPDGTGDNSFLRDEGYEFPPKVLPLKGASFFDQQRNVNKYLLYPTKYRNVSTNNLYSPNFICDSAPIVPLTSSASVVDSAIAGLQAVGATNVDEGVGWGWRVLSPSEPFAGSRAYSDDENIKALVLMTDGENTSYTSGNTNKSRFSSYGFAQLKDGSAGRIFDQSGASTTYSNTNYTVAMDGRTRKVCANAKKDGARPMTDINGVTLTDSQGTVQKDGIIIYTIAFDIPASSATRVNALLSDCASYRTDDLRKTTLPYAQKAKNFYSVKNAAELDAAFSDIAASLSKMRISR
jgi:Flp pilus assembly protein TadG